MKYFSIWMAYQCFVCSLLCPGRNCKFGIIGIDECVKGPFSTNYRVYKKKLNKFEIAPNVAKQLKVLSF